MGIWFLPLKVGNHSDFLACSWCVTYRWKTLNKGYNFAPNLISIGGLHAKLWAFKIIGVLVVGISGLPLGTKWHLGARPMAKHKVYYKGEGGGYPQVQAVVSFMNLCLPVARLCTKVLQLCMNQLVILFVQVHVSKWSACQSC